jgi:glycosyltransferase involved in cell wall biosynthesis
MSRPIRLTVVMTHPVQYLAPWFRHIAAQCPEIDLTVLYATRPTPEQQAVGFGGAFDWDIPLTDGYRYRIVRAPRPSDNFHSGRLRGVDVPEIGRAIRDSEPDAALIPGWHSVTLLRALWACRRARIPVLYRGDSNLASAPAGWRRPLWFARTRVLLRLFTGYLSVGHRARSYLRRFGVAGARIFDSPHCVDNAFFAESAARHRTPEGRAAARASFGLDPRDFAILFIGKLEGVKRPADVVRAAARLGSGVRLLVVGEGPLESELRAEAEGLNVPVTWAGFLNQSQIARAYAAADCLVLPGSETWGLVVNEALATGLPCVVSDRVGCAPDLITPGETGDVFRMADVAALADALGRVRRRIEAGHEWAPACRARASAYSYERATAGLLAACRAVAGQRSRPAAAATRRRAARVLACCGGMVGVSGLELATFEVLRMLRERGAAVHCVVNSWENHRIVPLAEAIGASWSTGRYRHRLSRRARNPITLAQAGLDIALTSVGLLRDAWRFRPTHVLVPEFGGIVRNAPALACLRPAGIRVVLHVLNAPAPGAFYQRLWRSGIDRLVDRFVCCSLDTQAGLVAHGVAASKTAVISNTAPRRREACENEIVRDPRRVIYVGQIIPEKGVDLLLDAVGELVKRGCDARLVIVGRMDGWVAPRYDGYRERLLARARAPDLVGRVEFLGWREDVPALMAGAGVHCSPSRPEMLEGMPLVCLEAKAAGLPSVAFPVGPFPELIAHGVDGWICREIGAGPLAEGLERFLSDPDRLERAGRAARMSAERFSHARAADAWWRLLAGQ